MHFAWSSVRLHFLCNITVQVHIPSVWALTLLLTSKAAEQSECSLMISPTAASLKVRSVPTHSSEPVGQETDQTDHKPQKKPQFFTCSHISNLFAQTNKTLSWFWRSVCEQNVFCSFISQCNVCNGWWCVLPGPTEAERSPALRLVSVQRNELQPSAQLDRENWRRCTESPNKIKGSLNHECESCVLGCRSAGVV